MDRRRIAIDLQEYITHSAEETLDLGIQLGRSLQKNDVLCFFGDLAAGKTTLIKGLVVGATGCSSHEVISPTYVYLNIYQGTKTVYHFDLYRLHDSDEFYSMGFHEMFEAGGICCIEWAERLEQTLPPNAVHFHLEHAGNDKRRIRIL